LPFFVCRKSEITPVFAESVYQRKTKMNKSSNPRLSDSVWILSDRQNDITAWMRKQIEQLVPKLCGSAPRFSMQLEGSFCIVMGSPDSNRFIKEAVLQSLIDIESLALH